MVNPENTRNIKKDGGKIFVAEVDKKAYKFIIFNLANKPVFQIESMYGYPEKNGSKFTDFETLVAAITVLEIPEIIENFSTKIRNPNAAAV